MSSEQKPVYRILAVDDQAVTRKMVAMILKNQGLLVDDAESGFAALELLDKHHYDLVVTDYRMPEMCGVELVKKLKQRADTLHVPIIMVTAENSDDIKKEAEEAGVDAWVPKPFKPHELVELVKESMHKKTRS